MNWSSRLTHKCVIKLTKSPTEVNSPEVYCDVRCGWQSRSFQMDSNPELGIWTPRDTPTKGAARFRIDMWFVVLKEGYDHSAVRSTGWSHEFKIIIPIKKIFEITRGEHLQEVPISTFLPKMVNLLFCIHKELRSLDYPIQETDNLEYTSRVARGAWYKLTSRKN
jgi:hypothetical protein